MMKHGTLLLMMGALGLSGLEAQTQVELPLVRVHLFTSGVGYFEHGASVEGNAQTRLSFSATQINDVLKSLVFRDLDGGTISTVQYPSKAPLQQALQSFAIDISSQAGIAGILGQVRGAELTLTTPSPVTGRLVGLETQQRPSVGTTGNAILVNEVVATLLTKDGLRSVILGPSVGVSFMDPRLTLELEKALTVLQGSNDPDKKFVDLGFSGSGRRRVRVGYVSETPVWKTSYRLDLSDGKPFLQAWAIVENNSEHDWNNVSLSLVAGRPVSFIQDLYTPLYIRRPVVQATLETAPAPQAFQEGRAPAPAPSVSAAPSAQRSVAMMAEREAYDDFPEEEMAGLSQDSVEVNASAERAGELFSFTLGQGLTLARRQSAMLPIYSGAINAEKLSIFTLGQSSQHPLNGARLINSSGLQLPGGPITVFDGGSYSGDALTTTLIAGDRRLISYGVDLAVLVQPKNQESRTISRVRIVSGVLSIDRLGVFTQTYGLQNKAPEAKQLLIEHPKVPGRTLVEPRAFDEETPSHYRFKVGLGQGANLDFVVKEQQVFTETMALLTSRPTSFLAYTSVGEVPRAVKEALTKAGELHGAVTNLNTRIADLGREKTSLENGQGRLRSNIETLGRDTAEGRRFLEKLMADETRIDTLTTQITRAQEDLRRAQMDLENYLKNLSVQ